jgi:putative FmdB family regulatory protein
MPTYEYACKQCGKSLEVFQSFSDKPLKKHAECGGELKKVFHARGIVFKGSGFYATDSKSSAAAKTAPGGDDAKSSDSKPSDAKPAAAKSDSQPPKAASASSQSKKPSSKES